MTKKSSSKNNKTSAQIINRRARFDYELGEEIVAGISLNGQEVRAVRDNRVNLKGAYVTIRNDELWLNNASFSIKINERGNPNLHSVDTRARKLLVHRKQLKQLSVCKNDGMTIVPVKILPKGKYIKVVISIGKGKKRWDKRESIKRRDLNREHQKSIKMHI